MTFHLYIMRHAKSDMAKIGMSDFERPINTKGKNSAIAVGQWMVENNAIPEKIISSPAKRAKQTIELVTEQFFNNESEGIVYEKDLYLAELDTLIEYIELYKANVESLMLLGHNPGLEYLIDFLSKGSGNEYQGMSPANMAIFEYSDNQFDAAVDKGKLVAFIKPKDLS